MRIITLLIAFFLISSITYSQDFIKGINASVYSDAGEGDLYVSTPNDVIYLGLSSGFLKKLDLQLADVLTNGNTANKTITGLPTPIANSDAATKNYVDTKIVSQEVSINEYLAEELVLARDGQIIYTVPNNLDGAEVIGARCSVYSAGSAGGTTDINIVRRRNGANLTVASVSIPATSYSNDVTSSGDFIQQGDILKLDTTATSSTPPEGLTCTITFQK